MDQLRRCQPLWLLFLTATACTSATEPRSGMTLLVTNVACQTDQCAPVMVLGFPDNQPHTPGGLWSLELGLVTTASACLELPATATFRVIGWSADGTRADTTLFPWTSARGLSLGTRLPSESGFRASPSTLEFAPAKSSGWSVSLPGTGAVSPAPACNPD